MPLRLRTDRLLVLALLFGLALRGFHYLRDPDVWHDEAALIVNCLDKTFLEQLGPLYWAEAAPPLFLWLTRAVALAFGDSTLALRAPAFLASCGSLLLTAAPARRLLPASGAVWTVLLLAGSDALLWHTCEAKPYAIDAFLASLLLAAHVFTDGWPAARRFLLLAAISPLVIFLSFPGAFLLGASLVAMLPTLRREWGGRVAVSYALWAACVFGPFLLLVLGPAGAQRCGNLDACWVKELADWGRPWSVPLWSGRAAMGVLSYCFKPIGEFLAGFALLGAFALWPRRRAVVVLALGPIALAWLAACLGKYPFGAARVMMFAAPGLALVLGAGAAAMFACSRRKAVLGLGVAMLSVTPIKGIYNVARPWTRASCAEAVRVLPPDGVVVANNWESVYYLRGTGRLRMWGGDSHDRPRMATPALPDDAFTAKCLIVVSPLADVRQRVYAGTPFAGRRVSERRELQGVTVFVFE